jgi:hypothetical protein
MRNRQLCSWLKNFPAFCGTRRFITLFTRALHRSLSWAWLTQAVPPDPLSLRSVLISIYLPLVLLRSDLFCYAALDCIILVTLGEVYEAWNSGVCSFIHPPVTFILFGPNNSPQHPCSQTPFVNLRALMSETEIHTHAEPQAKLWFYIYCNLCVFR